MLNCSFSTFLRHEEPPKFCSKNWRHLSIHAWSAFSASAHQWGIVTKSKARLSYQADLVEKVGLDGTDFQETNNKHHLPSPDPELTDEKGGRMTKKHWRQIRDVEAMTEFNCLCSSERKEPRKIFYMDTYRHKKYMCIRERERNYLYRNNFC